MTGSESARVFHSEAAAPAGETGKNGSRGRTFAFARERLRLPHAEPLIAAGGHGNRLPRVECERSDALAVRHINARVENVRAGIVVVAPKPKRDFERNARLFIMIDLCERRRATCQRPPLCLYERRGQRRAPLPSTCHRD